MTMLPRYVDGFFGREPRETIDVHPNRRPSSPAPGLEKSAKSVLGRVVSREQLTENPARSFRRCGFAALAAALWFVQAPDVLATELRKGPYLQALGQKVVTVKFELSAPETATLDITGPAGFHATRVDDSSKRFHAIRMDGLSPATTYTYKILAGGAESKPVEFTTAPPDDRPFKFLAYGDSRSDPSTHAAITRLLEKAPGDFFVHTGDMVHDGDNEAEWQELFSIENKLLASRCAFVSVGNHELTTPDPAGQITFLRYFASVEDDGRERPHLYGSFRWSNTRFFLLNAMDAWTGDEREWLRAELASAMNEPGLLHRIAVLHHGPFSSGRHGGNKRLHANGIVGMLRDGNVELVLAGHDHAYERGEGQGLKYLVSGGAGAPLYSKDNPTPETLYFESVHHFLELSVDGDKISVLARRASGSVIETCSFKGKESWSCSSGDGKTPDKKGASAAPASLRAPQPVSSSCGCRAAGSTGETSGAGLVLFLGGLVVLSGRRRRLFG